MVHLADLVFKERALRGREGLISPLLARSNDSFVVNWAKPSLVEREVLDLPGHCLVQIKIGQVDLHIAGSTGRRTPHTSLQLK